MKRGAARRTVSCGVVILDAAGRVFLAHATDTTHWDIPKGQGEPGETPADAALRELLEETGIVIGAERLLDLGRFAYRHDKDLHLFAVRVADDEVDLAHCTCTSLFPSRRDGSMIPRWMRIAGPCPPTSTRMRAAASRGCFARSCRWWICIGG